MKIGSCNVDEGVLKELNKNVDEAVNLCMKDSFIRYLAEKFQQSHITDKATFDFHSSDRASHFIRTLERMTDLAVSLSVKLLYRILGSTPQPCRSDSFVASATLKLKQNNDESSTVDSSNWREWSATLLLLCANILSLVILACKEHREKMQLYILNCRTLEYVYKALSVSKDHEINYYIEGHKSELVRLLANISFENKAACRAISDNNDLLLCILSCTQIDELNPGIGEWSKFTIRNICELSDEAREKINGLKAISLSFESEEIFQNQKYGIPQPHIPLKR